MLTYMASCGSTTCDKFNAANAKWFKIQQIGRKNGNGDWAQADLSMSFFSISCLIIYSFFSVTGGVASATIPSNLAPGNYLIRHEIIALHLATSFNGAEFYPGCAQLRVGGSQTGVPKDSDLVSLPGAYSDNNPGIFDPSVFDNNAKYVFPGPAIASFVSGSPSNGSSGATPTSSSGPSPTKAPTKSCKIKKRAAASDEQNLVVRRPRHISRIMQRLGESLH